MIALIKNGYVKTFADIYKLNDLKDELIRNNIFGKEKGTGRVLEAIEKSKNKRSYKAADRTWNKKCRKEYSKVNYEAFFFN